MSGDIMASVVPAAALPEPSQEVAEEPVRDALLVPTAAPGEVVEEADPVAVVEEPEEPEEPEVDPIQHAVESIDGTLRELVTEMRALRDRVESLEGQVNVHPARAAKDLVDDAHWTTRLFAVTRSGRAIVGEDGEPVPEGDPLLDQLGRIDADAGSPANVFGAIVNSQR